MEFVEKEEEEETGEEGKGCVVEVRTVEQARGA